MNSQPEADIVEWQATGDLATILKSLATPTKPNPPKDGDGERVNSSDLFELYMVDSATPGVSKKLNPALVVGRNVSQFQLLP